MLKIVSKGNFHSIDEFDFLDNKKLGSGSFGTVHLALHKNSVRMYAIKMISLCSLPSETESRLVQRQIKLHSQMDHPHIIKVWDTFNDEQNIYMVMQFAQMGNLFYFQNTKNIFSEIEAYKYFVQTLTAVRYMHTNDIIHRDLKPQNLLLDVDGNIKICDFGWAAQSITTKRTTFCGTYQYMAPEMIFRTEYDYRVDIWALGILLYQMLHGFAPFKGKAISEVQDSMLKGSYDINQKLSTNVKNLISQILQFNGDLRLSLQNIAAHQWMKEMQDTIKDYLREQKVCLPRQIEPKLAKLPISMLQLRKLKKSIKQPIVMNKKSQNHRKNNSMNLDQQVSNINISLSINNYSILKKQSKTNQLYHSQQKFHNQPQQKNYKQTINRFNSLKQNKKSQNMQMRCRTLVDEQISPHRQVFNALNATLKTKQNNYIPVNNEYRKNSKVDFNCKKPFNRKSQDKADKPIRFNTQMYDKDDESYLAKLKKNTKKSKVLTNTKNIKSIKICS